MPKQYIIIGGGAAGIAAAYKILESSRTAVVHLFEATNIYGGRAKTDKSSIPGLPFDKGCVYIQDPKNPENPWPKIAGQLGFKTVEEKDSYKMRINTGQGFQTVDTTAIPAINQVVSFLEKEYEASKQLPNKAVTSKPRSTDQNEEFALALSPYGPYTEATEPWNYLAADRAREASGNWGENLFVEDGLGTLVKTYGEGLKKKYGSRFTETFVAVKSIVYGKGVTVTDITNKQYTADACIITASVGVLASGSIAFSPALPQSYKSALQALKMGSYKKLAIQFEALPSGIDDNVNYYLYNNQPQGIWQYYRLASYPNNVLVVHTSGEFAAALDKMDNTAVIQLFGTTFKAAYGSGVKLTAKSGITNWGTDKNVLGAYSYTAPMGSNVNDPAALKARKEMAKPINQQIFFAGEAYHLKAYGTLHGAYIDGQDAAENVLQIHEKK